MAKSIIMDVRNGCETIKSMFSSNIFGFALWYAAQSVRKIPMSGSAAWPCSRIISKTVPRYGTIRSMLCRAVKVDIMLEALESRGASSWRAAAFARSNSALGYAAGQPFPKPPW